MMENNNEKYNNQLQLDLNEQVAKGSYSNLAVIAHSSSEFVLDFAKVLPGMSKGIVESRIIMAPEHAKRLLFALQDNISKYELTFGAIKMPERTLNPPLHEVKGEA